MNHQMMEFGNQSGGYSQSGNYTGSYSPPGGGPPPPPTVNNSSLENFPPSTTQLSQSGPPPSSSSSSSQLKNLSAPPTSITSASFIAPQGPQGPSVPTGPLAMPQTGSLNGPPSYHPQQMMPNAGPFMRPPGYQSYQSMQSSGSLNDPFSLSQHSGPLDRPPVSQPSGPLDRPPVSQPSGPLDRPPVSQHLGLLDRPPVSQHSGSLDRPPVSQLPHAPQGFSLVNGPPSSTSVSQSTGPPLSGPSGQPSSQSASTPLGMLSSPPGPQMNNSAPPISGQQYGLPQINGSPVAPSMPPMSGQMDSSRQFINGASQNQFGGVPPMQQRPPLGYGSPGQMQTPPTGLAKPMYPSASNINQQNVAGPPYSQTLQSRLPYPPTSGTLNKDNYPGAPPAPYQNEMRPGYPLSSQGNHPPLGPTYSGLNQNYPSMTSPTYSQQQPQQKSQRKLDPDMLPSPIQVMQDDEKNRSGIFYTDQKGLMPPLVSTNFITQDQGNCSPRFLRCTTYNVPVTADLLKQTNVPFALLISPLARTVEGEQPPPIVNMGELGPVRCIRCKAYMSPFMQFIDGGRRFHCVFCKATTEVPAEYFQHLDHTGQRVDRFERPELVLGAYEFIATKDYCRNNQPAEPPAMIFVIDVSYNNVKSGLVHLLCAKMKEIIQNLPKDEGLELSSMKVGFITYSTSVHFYNIKSCLAAPQMLLVGDVNEMFMPLLDGFLCDPIESEAVIDLLMQEIPKQFAETRETETILYPAIQAGLEALKASGCAGKLIVFHSSLPIGEAPGKLKNRDDRKVLNTEKEKAVLGPQNNSYNSLGQDCVQAGCSVDLFIFNNSYVDIATIGEISRLTGGEIFKYTYFQADIDGERFITDLKRTVSRQIAFDAIMRVRTSTGVRPTEFYGHFFMSNTKDMELASIDSDKAVAVEIKHDDKLTEEDGVYIQVALLYTSCGGQRRLRILNLSLKTCSQMADLYRCCDLDTLVNYLAKQGIFKLLESSPKQVKNNIMNRCANILACYRKNCANPSSTGQLILPECMKLLPLYVNTLLKSDAFSGGSDMTCDDRSFAMHYVMIMDLTVSVVYFYPRLIALHNIDPDSFDIPLPIRCTYEKLQEDGVYLLDNGIHMFMWLGLNAPTSFISNVFGVPTTSQVDTDKTALPALDNPLSYRIRKLINDIREKRHRSMRLTVLKQKDKMEIVFKQYLMEDHGSDGSPSYADFLCHMHSQIRTILS